MYARVETERLEDLPDVDLVRRFRSGDDAALEVLLKRHAEDLQRFCLHLVPNRQDAEDICQESLARAIDRVDSLQTGAAFRGWLFRIAKNLSVDSFRSRRRLCPLPDEETTVLPVQVDGPHDRIEVGEEREMVARALGRLTQNHQRVLVLREVEGLSYADIARKLQVSLSAVETLLFRARRRLREEYIKSEGRAPGLAFFAGLRLLTERLAAPLTGVPVAKIAVTAAVVGGAALSAHHVGSSHRSPRVGHAALPRTGDRGMVAARPSARNLRAARPLSAVHSHLSFSYHSEALIKPLRPSVSHSFEAKARTVKVITGRVHSTSSRFDRGVSGSARSPGLQVSHPVVARVAERHVVAPHWLSGTRLAVASRWPEARAQPTLAVVHVTYPSRNRVVASFFPHSPQSGKRVAATDVMPGSFSGHVARHEGVRPAGFSSTVPQADGQTGRGDFGRGVPGISSPGRTNGNGRADSPTMPPAGETGIAQAHGHDNKQPSSGSRPASPAADSPPVEPPNTSAPPGHGNKGRSK